MGFLEKMIFNEMETLPLSEAQLLEKREALYLEIIKIPAIQEALRLLDRLPTHLEYHTKGHTIDVIKETILFALADGISRGAIEQQAIAAAWHDVGYIEENTKNEPIAIKLFENSIAYAELSPEIREEVIANISDTTITFLNGKPVQKMERSSLGYVLDADVSNFGRDDFFTCMDNITEENEKINIDKNGSPIKVSVQENLEKVIAFLENHTWKTEGARRLRDHKKQLNLKILKVYLANIQRKVA